ncbi:hypothetical protein SCLCIDRAFT_46451, partial [Scleroderma citrinum Foug A]
MVIPAMDYIDEVFTTGMLDHTHFDPAICATIRLAKKTLNKYYSLTDSSKVYCIAMILHPCYKLEYFKQAKWNVDWIDTAQDLIRATYDSTYAPCHVQEDDRSATESSTCAGEARSTNIFDNLPCLTKFRPIHGCDKLDTYLTTGMEDVAPGDGLKWWHEWHATYPCL